jgi:hypothetical protein
VALALASTTLFGLAAEACARITVRRWSSQDARRVPLIEPHPTLGWVKPARASAWIRRSEYLVHLQINSHGLRGPEIPWARPAGVARVLLLGDSFTEGFCVAEEDTVRARLESQLRELVGPLQVVNGGTTGYSTDQELLFYLEQGRRYEPDVVVLLVYYNDLSDDTVGGLDKPRFDLVDGELQLRNSPVPPPSPEVEEWLRRGFQLKPLRGSMALRLLSDHTAARNPGVHAALVELGLAEPRRVPDTLPEEFWPFRPPRQLGRAPWRKPTALLAAIAEAVRADGARLVVFYVPARFEIDAAAWELTRARYSLGRRWTREGAISWLRETCRALGVPLIDPRPAMRASQDAGHPPYFAIDGHWNEDGHAIAAREISAELRHELSASAARRGPGRGARGPDRPLVPDGDRAANDQTRSGTTKGSR